MRCAILGLVAGAALLQNQASLWPKPILLLLLLLSLISFVFTCKLDHVAVRVACCLLGGAIAGFAWAGLYAHYHLSHDLPKEWEGRDVTLVGTIDSLPSSMEQGVRFNFAVERVVEPPDAAEAIPPRLALSWYTAFRAEELQAVGKVLPGERWQLTVRLRRPHGNANPYGFDYEVWLLEQNLRATGYVRPDANTRHKNQRLDTFVVSPRSIVERSRGWLRERILDALPDKDYAGVIVALVIGDQRAVNQSDWQVFNRSGVGHLISISGLHITMIAGLFSALVFSLWRRSFFTALDLPLLLPAQKAAALAGVCIALTYVSLAGFGIPAQRTLYMLSVVALALWVGRISAVSHVLCAALGLVVLLDPWAVLWPGFWLSFGAVAILLYATVGRAQSYSMVQHTRTEKTFSSLKAASHTQYVVTIGLVPLTMLLFGQVSLISPVANAIAIPLVSFVVTPLSLAGSVLPSPWSAWMLGCAHWIIESLAGVLAWMSAFPSAVWTTPLSSWPAFMAALIGTLWMLAPRGWPVRWLGVAGLVPLLIARPTHPNDGQAWVTAFDVGQGMALLIETPRKRLLYDTGPAFSSESDGGNRVILPYLKARGIDTLDAMIVSHSDNDHSGGALSILREINVKKLMSSLPANHSIVTQSSQHEHCLAGQQWEWDGMHFEMLHPSVENYDNAKLKPNGRSCTLRIAIGSQSMLLAGDIEAPQETDLLRRRGEELRSTVLLAPHHGSGTSSTKAFLNAVQPRLALFQVGYRNRYHHPKTEVFERYAHLGIERVRSDDAGAVSIVFDGNRNGDAVTWKEYRKEHARYWYGH
ncbi:DNA internalization-related competence protein ComEC/Rec2 [Herbaspirillum sp. GCM10030257]|uniref:DNA internalization-related competence protein ComEC/Rec2 n=1 Tax=Herbaspirillum sp. GCM10030257 TaxID=3273393 RepID=UPI003621BB74